MKKYLMTAMAAVAMGVAFTSCSHNTDLYGGEEGGGKINGRTAKEQIELDKAVYKAVFEQSFGKVAPTVDWGFGPSTRALTRSGNTGETYAQTHGDENGGANMNCNEWADPDKECGGWVVPDPLTAEQKAVVTAYFQSGPDIDFEDPHFRHFFVQQVYKGGSAQAGTSTENITAANNSVYNSNNMNLLTVGETNIHINNYNAGTCTERDVLDNGQKVGGTSHKDQITLMVNIDDTSCFGYHETGSSTHHNNKAAIVGWETIDTWAKTNYAGYNGCLKDDWNRSFMGFDLAIKEGAQAYATDGEGNVLYATYDQAPDSPRYAWDGEKIIDMAASVERVYPDPNNLYWYNEIIVLKDEYKSIFGCGWLTTKENFYVAADKVTLQQTISINRAQLSSLEGIQNCVVLKEVMDGNQWYQSVINLPRIKQLVDAGYLPVKDKSLQDWVKVGKSDGYFTDWIVTLTEAKRIDDEQETSSYRVIAEDLSVDNQSDFDFNDVVFDVDPDDDGYGATITIHAAGGIWPLKINGEEIHEKLIPGIQKFDYEDKKTGKTYQCYPMINTQAAEHGESTSNQPTISVRTAEKVWDSDDNIRNSIRDYIHLIVYKYDDTDGEELYANEGDAACKILVDKNFKINSERNNIANGTKFKDFVTGKLIGRVWW